MTPTSVYRYYDKHGRYEEMIGEIQSSSRSLHPPEAPA